MNPATPQAAPQAAPESTVWQLVALPFGPLGLAWTADGRLAGSQLPESPDDGPATARRMARRFPSARRAADDAPLPEPVASWVRRLRAVMGAPGAAANACGGPAHPAPDRLDDIPLADDHLSAFHRRVWAVARQIAPGHTLSYGEIAERLGETPAAARAVGQALGANPFPPFVPCHRVLAAGGQSGGFSAPGGRHTKLRLLELEGATFEWQAQQRGLF